MQMKEKSGTSALKKVSNSLQNARKNVEADVNLLENLTSAKGAFGQMQQIIRNQAVGLEHLRNFSRENNTQSSKNLQLKRFFFGYLEKSRGELRALLQVAKQNFILTFKSKSTDNWQKTEKQLEKGLNSLKDQADSPQKMFAGVTRLNAVKQTFLCQFLRLMLYRKNVLWRDLNAPYDDYIHGEIKAAINLIKSQQQKLGYVPHSLQFIAPRFQGDYGESSLHDLLRIALADHNELIEGLKNYSKLSDQPQVIEDISKNQHIVRGLRERIEVLTQTHESLMQKYRTLQISKGKHSASDQKSLTQKMEQMQNLLMKKEQQIIQLKQASLKQDAYMATLKEKNKQLQDQLSKWLKNQGPRLKQMQGNQKSILQEFNKVRRDMQTYSNMLQNQRQEKIKTLDDLKSEKQRVHDLANILGRERRRIKQLKMQISRQQKIVLQLLDKIPDR